METKAIIWQVVIGLVVSYALYIIAVVVMRQDIINMEQKYNPAKKSNVVVFPGYVESANIVNARFNTQNPTVPNYLTINPSMNLKGGAQFSYSMWLKIDEPESAINKCIFLKGDPNIYPYGVSEKASGRNYTVKDRTALCPMLSFGYKPMEFTVTFNTLNKMHETLKIESIKSDNELYRKNLLSLFASKWFCLTIVFEDNMPINDFENGIIVKAFINDTLYQTGKYTSTLKQNLGDLCFFPESVPKCKISDFTYYNHALNDLHIKQMVAKGPNTRPFTATVSDAVMIPYYVSDYNKLDMYNT